MYLDTQQSIKEAAKIFPAYVLAITRKCRLGIDEVRCLVLTKHGR